MQTVNFESLVRTLIGFIAVVFLVFGLSSYTHYSTLGIDNEQVQGEQVDYHYYRLWWPGNGALLIGGGASFKPYNPANHYDLFDPAGTVFRTPHKHLEAQSWWNRIGFWYIHDSSTRQFWLGLPALLPALVLIWLWWRLRRSTVS